MAQTQPAAPFHRCGDGGLEEFDSVPVDPQQVSRSNEDLVQFVAIMWASWPPYGVIIFSSLNEGIENSIENVKEEISFCNNF